MVCSETRSRLSPFAAIAGHAGNGPGIGTWEWVCAWAYSLGIWASVRRLGRYKLRSVNNGDQSGRLTFSA